MSDKMLNRKLGRYEIKELIGEGAMAKVYRAYDPEINRSVACKILKADHCVDEEYVSRFLSEAKAAGGLSHTSIVTVFDVGEVDNSPYIMMELLQGSDLSEVLKQKQKIGIRETITIALQLAKALDYAHSKGIVHRDIKPDNIIVLPDGETIKVADFGIARMSENEEAQKTQIGSVLGTPRYMSPEQALSESVDGRSDLFSVGVIMYEMLTGKKAFEATNMGALMIQITQKQPEQIKRLNPDVPTGLRQIIQKLLQKSPDKRFQNGEELASALVKELNALRDQQEEQKRHKYLPLKVKWTLASVVTVSIVMIISMMTVFGHQSSAMTKQAVDSGSSFARFIATETAVPLLSEDWITLEVFINDAAGRDTFAYLIVTDRDGVIRGASDTSLVGQNYVESEEAEFVSKTEDIYTTISSGPEGVDVFNVSTPVLFQDTEVGNIIVGLSQEGLQDVKSITGWLMFLLAIITISLVAVIVFIITGLISKPLGTITEALSSLRDGDLDARISLSRQDEFGELFDVFNDTAKSIQTRYTKVSDELAQSGIQKPEDRLESSSIMRLKDEDVDDATILAGTLSKGFEEKPEGLSKALADDSTVIAPAKPNSAKTLKAKGAEAKSAKQNEQETNKVDGKSSEAKSTDAKKPDTKNTDAKSSEAKSTDAKKPDTKTTNAKSSDAKTTDAKKPDAKATDAKSSDAKTTDAKSSDAKTTDAKSSDAKTTDSKKPDAKTTDAKSPDLKSTDAKSPDLKSADAKSTDTKKTEKTAVKTSDKKPLTTAANSKKAMATEASETLKDKSSKES